MIFTPNLVSYFTILNYGPQLIGHTMHQLEDFTFFTNPIMNQLDLFPANFQFTVMSSSHTPDVETAPKDNFPPKTIPCNILVFVYKSLIIFSLNLFSV